MLRPKWSKYNWSVWVLSLLDGASASTVFGVRFILKVACEWQWIENRGGRKELVNAGKWLALRTCRLITWLSIELCGSMNTPAELVNSSRNQNRCKKAFVNVSGWLGGLVPTMIVWYLIESYNSWNIRWQKAGSGARWLLLPAGRLIVSLLSESCSKVWILLQDSSTDTRNRITATNRLVVYGNVQ